MTSVVGLAAVVVFIVLAALGEHLIRRVPRQDEHEENER